MEEPRRLAVQCSEAAKRHQSGRRNDATGAKPLGEARTTTALTRRLAEANEDVCAPAARSSLWSSCFDQLRDAGEKFGFNCVIQTKRVGRRSDLTRLFARRRREDLWEGLNRGDLDCGGFTAA